MRISWAVAVLTALLAPVAARADGYSPGFKSPRLFVAFDNLGDYPDHVFYLVRAELLTPDEAEYGSNRPAPPSR